MGLPVSSFQRSPTACCKAMPPATKSLLGPKSILAKSAWFINALKSVFRPVNIVKRQLRMTLTKAGMSRGFVIKTSLEPMCASIQVRATSSAPLTSKPSDDSQPQRLSPLRRRAKPRTSAL